MITGTLIDIRAIGISTVVGLRGLNKKEGFDVAEDGEAWICGSGVKPAEIRNSSSERRLTEDQISVFHIGHWSEVIAESWATSAEKWTISSATQRIFRATDVIIDVEIKVDSDSLEKIVLQADKTDFDGDLQILKTPILKTPQSSVANGCCLVTMGCRFRNRSRLVAFQAWLWIDAGVRAGQQEARFESLAARAKTAAGSVDS